MPTYMKFILGTHVAAGFIVLLTGILVYLLRKGNKPHKQLGWIYFWSMMVISISGVGLILYRFNNFLLIIVVLTFYLSYTGAFSFRRKSGSPSNLDWIASIVSVITGLWSIGNAVAVFIYTGGFHPLIILYGLFGFLLGANAWNDLKWFRDPAIMTGKWRIEYHIVRMGASFIAATTAFALAGSRSYTEGWDYAWTLWIIPTFIGTPLISYYKRNYFRPKSTKG